MTPSLRAFALTALAAACMPALAIDLNANIEFDNTYLNQDRGLSQSGRVELNALGKVSPKYFIAGKASFLAKKDGGVSTDDMWVQFGSATADLKLGRFEAADLFPLPRDAIVLYAVNNGTPATAADDAFVYRANLLRGRFANSTEDRGISQGVFHAAGTYNFGGGLSAELGVVETRDSKDTNKGVRPVLTYAVGPVLLRAGVEALKFPNKRSETGFGVTGSYDFNGIRPIVSLASVKNADGFRQNTVGLILDTTMGLTVGYIRGVTKQAVGDYKVQTGYAAYAMPLLDIKGASVTFAGSYSKAGGVNTSDDEKGIKVRFNYTF